MKTVFEYFLDFADSKLADKDKDCVEKVKKGIKVFLTEFDMCNEPDPDGKISERELLRFRLMPADTFASFFEYYDVRSLITQFVRECQLLAINRLKNHVTISPTTRTQKLNEFYNMTAVLAADKRYSSWIDDMVNIVRTDLTFATGQSDYITQDIAEWLEINS